MKENLISAEQSLEGGKSTENVVRVGNTVRRPISANGQYVHELLLYLEEAGTSFAPRFVGLDEQGREILTYFEGEVPHNVQDIKWTNNQLTEASQLLRKLHDATAGSPLAKTGEVVCHNDFAPWNVVFVQDVPSFIIDFDDAKSGSHIKDLSYALWCWLGVGSDVHSVEEQAIRIKLMCEKYGEQDLSEVLFEMAKRQQEIRAKHLLEGRLEQARGVDKDIEWLNNNFASLQDMMRAL